MKLKTKFLYTLILLAILIGCVAYYVSVLSIHLLMQQQINAYTTSIHKKFTDLRTQEIRTLTLGTRFFEKDQNAREAFLSMDRVALQRTMEPLFAEIRDAYGVTHFNFLLPDGTIFLRLQEPEKFGDTVKRQLFIQAQKTQHIQSSIELGRNAFALRVIAPYYNDHELIGYIEIGREITNFLDILTHETGDSFAMYGIKAHLDRADFATSMLRKGQEDQWDTRPHDVLLATTQDEKRAATQCAENIDTTTLSTDRSLQKEIVIDQYTYLCTSFPILNTDNSQIATIIVAHDITSILATNRHIFIMEIITIFGIFCLFFIIFYTLVNRIILRPVRELTHASTRVASGDYSQKITHISKDEIGRLALFFNAMIQQLEKSATEITRALTEKEEALIRSDALAHDLEKFKRAADSASDFIIITDVTGKIIYANSAAENMSGLSHEDLLSLSDAVSHFWGGKTDPEHYTHIWHMIKERKESFTGTITNKTIFGKKYHVALSIAPIFNEFHDVIFFVGIGKDVTREKEIEEAKDNFVSLVSHQLRTPLTSIKWLLELLVDPKTGHLNNKQKKFLDEAYTSTRRLALLVSDILNINRIEMGRITITKKPSDISSLIIDVLQEMQPLISSKNLLITRQTDVQVPLIEMDPVLIRQVLMNIMSNAIKYTPPKGIISIQIDDLQDRIRVTITDTGIGIPSKEQGRIFERFYRASNVLTNDQDGTGLGLFIAKMIITMCDGSIGFYSQENHGTSVWFTLPIKNEKRDERSSHST